MSKATKHAQEELEMDMTPMIDCVFLLMIFFVLVIDLSQQDLEDLILPKALYAVPDDQPADVRPIVNIAQSGNIIYKKNQWADPKVADKQYTEDIHKLLVYWRDNVCKKENIKKETVGGGMTMTVVDDPVLIRADKWTEWHYVGKFMTACTQKDAAFWKLELAMSEEDKEAKLQK
ncbi:MAG: biopolymer transporter ExbD [Planctomycetota bacterium]|nr:biopolymer transporter ExbD [Planctomycetota bacterium]